MGLLFDGLIIFALIVTPSVVGVFAVRHYMPAAFHRANSEAAEPIWAIVGVTFGLLLGFLVVNLWGDLQAAQETVQNEANDLLSMYQLTYGLSEPATPAELREQIVTYARLVVDDEWPNLASHRSDPQVDAAFDRLWKSYLRLDPAMGAEESSYAESLRFLSDLQGARNRRINAAHNVVPAALWTVLLCGVALMIVTIWFTGSEDVRTHLFMTVVLAISLASVLFLIRAFNNPFQGDIHVDAEPIERVLRQIEQ